MLYSWICDGYVKAGLEKEKAALLVAGGLLDEHKVILAVEPDYRNSTESWHGALCNLRERGLTGLIW